MRTITALFALALLMLQSCSLEQQQITPDEAKEIAKEAYIYGFPLVLNYKTMYSYTINTKSPELKGDFNTIRM
jgi:hypothetical protein